MRLGFLCELSAVFTLKVSLIFSENKKKIIKNAICCCCDRLYKGSKIHEHEDEVKQYYALFLINVFYNHCTCTFFNFIVYTVHVVFAFAFSVCWHTLP